MYPGPKCENLPFPIKIQLSQKEKTFSEFFFAFMEPPSNFKYFQTKGDRHSQCISEMNDPLRVG